MDPWFLSLQEYAKVLIKIVPGYLVLYYGFQLYTPKRVQGRRLEAWHIIQANVIGLMAVSLRLYLCKQPDFSRGMIFVFFLVNVFLEVVVRKIIREVLRDMRKQGYNQKHILLIGYSRAAEQYIDRIKANPEWGYIVRGILADNVPRGTEYKGIKVLGRIDNLMIVLPENKLDEIAITLGLAEYHKLEKIVGMLSLIHISKIHNELGWLPETKFEDGIKKTIKWYLENKEWWETIISGEYQNYYEKMYAHREEI